MREEKIVFKEFKNENIHTINMTKIFYKESKDFYCNGELFKNVKTRQIKRNFKEDVEVEFKFNEKYKEIYKNSYDFKKILSYVKSFLTVNPKAENSEDFSYYFSDKFSDTSSVEEDLKLFYNFSVKKMGACLFRINQQGKILSLNRNYLDIEAKILDIKNLEEENNSILTLDITITYSFYECPKCHEKFKSLFYNNRKILGDYIFINEDSIKHSIIYKESYYDTKLEKVYCRTYKDLEIYKKTNHNVYIIKNINISGNKYFRLSNPTKIKNYSYNYKAFYHDRFEKDLEESSNYFRNLIIEDYKKTDENLVKYTELDYDNYLENVNSKCTKEDLLIILLYIKTKLNINNTALTYYILICRMFDNKLINELKGKTEKEMLKYLRITLKEVQSMLLHNKYLHNPALIFYKGMDYNNVKKLRDSSDFITSMNIPKSNNFLYQYKKNNTEKRFVNQLLSTESYMLFDTQLMHRKIKESIKDYYVDYSLSIKQLHDIFSLDYNKLSHKNKKISRNKELYKVCSNMKFNNIKYLLPRETDELISVGSKMNICVGSYGERAVRKDCFIVVGYDNEKPVTCIELRKSEDRFSLIQVKKYHNKLPSKEEAEYIYNKFIKENNYISNTCDLSNFKWIGN